MDPWLADEHTWRQHEYGCPEFPPLDAVFRDGDRRYFIAVLPTYGDIDEARQLSHGKIHSSGGLYPITMLFELFGILVGFLLSSRNQVSMIVVSREPVAGGNEWKSSIER